MRYFFPIVLCVVVVMGFLGCTSASSSDSNSASPNQCASIKCQNGGVCDNGSCVCPTGYTGTLCQTEAPGDLLFWANATTIGLYGTITVYLDTAGADNSLPIIHSVPSAPQCDATYGALFTPSTLGVHTYKAVASTGGQVWRGSVVLSNTCMTVQIQ